MWTFSAAHGLLFSGMAAASGSTRNIIGTGDIPAVSKRQIFACASNRGFTDCRVQHGNMVAYGPLPSWVSISGKSFIPDGTGATFTDFNLPTGLSMYSNSYNTPSWHSASAYGRVHSQGLIRVSGVTSHINACTNMPLHSERDIFVCYSNRGPTRCDVYFNRIRLMNPRGTSWSDMTWVSVDGVVSFPSSQGFNALALTAGKSRYSTGYANPSFRKIVNTVHLRGLVRLSEVITTTNRLIATLPVGDRPRAREVFLTNCGGNFCRVDVLPDGRVMVINQGNLGWLSLAGISFTAL